MFNFVLKCIYSHPVISLGPRAIIFDHHQQNYVCTNKSFAAQHATAIYDRLRSFLGCFNFLQYGNAMRKTRLWKPQGAQNIPISLFIKLQRIKASTGVTCNCHMTSDDLNDRLKKLFWDVLTSCNESKEPI